MSCILHDDLKVCVPIAEVPYEKALHLYRRTSHGQRLSLNAHCGLSKAVALLFSFCASIV